MDISNLTRKELENLEKEIKERKKEIEKAEYEGLVNGVINAIRAIVEADYSNKEAYYDCDGTPVDWEELLYAIFDKKEEYKRRKEDY